VAGQDRRTDLPERLADPANRRDGVEFGEAIRPRRTRVRHDDQRLQVRAADRGVAPVDQRRQVQREGCPLLEAEELPGTVELPTHPLPSERLEFVLLDREQDMQHVVRRFRGPLRTLECASNPPANTACPNAVPYASSSPRSL